MSKEKFVHIYYLLLILVLAFYTNMSNSPSLIIRLGYLIAVVVPLFYRIEFFPAVIICSLGISKNAFSYPLMPTEMYYYIILAVGFAVLALSSNKQRIGIKPLFIIAFLFVAINDLLTQGSLSSTVITFLIFICFYICAERNLDKAIAYFPISFILISMTLSYWVIFKKEAQINIYNTIEGMEQLGWTDPNYLGAVVGIGLVIAVRELLLGEKRITIRILLIFTIVISVLSMARLASRGAIVSMTVSVALLMVFSHVKKWTKYSVIALSVLFILFLYSNQYFDFVLARFQLEDGTGNNRTLIWSSKLMDYYYNGNLASFVFGVGQKACFDYGLYVDGSSTHNDFVSIIISYGLVGVVLLISIIRYPIVIGSRILRSQILALIIYLLICSMTIEPLTRGNIVYWGFFFYIILLAKQSHKKQLSK